MTPTTYLTAKQVHAALAISHHDNMLIIAAMITIAVLSSLGAWLLRRGRG